MFITTYSFIFYLFVLTSQWHANYDEFVVLRMNTTGTSNKNRIVLINYLSSPGIDVLHFSPDELVIAMPKSFTNIFYKIFICGNVSTIDIKNYYTMSQEVSNITKPIYNTTNVEETDGVEFLMKTKKINEMQLNFNHYPSYEAIVIYLKYLAKRYPHRMKLVRIGRSTNNQTMYMVKIFNQFRRSNVAFIDAGMHAREWITIMLALYLIQQLVENSHSYPEVINVRWFIIPVANPDGFVYSYTHPKGRMWKKNRNCYTECSTGHCGVDLFRNFLPHFELSLLGLKPPCSVFYGGITPLSEIESKNLAKVLVKHKTVIKIYVGLHSYGGYILYPWSHKNSPCQDYDELENVAQAAVDVMNKISPTKIKYKVRNYGSQMYPAVGTPLDFIKGRLNVKFSYIFQIRKSESETTGFAPKDITDLIYEALHGVIAMASCADSERPIPKHELRLMTNIKRMSKRNAANIKKINFNNILLTYFIAVII